MAISREERLKRKRLAEKKRRLRMKEDPDRYQEEKDKRNVRNRENTRARRLKKLSKKDLEAQRKKWRLAKQRYVAKKKQQAATEEVAAQPTTSTRAESIRLEAKRRAAKHHEDVGDNELVKEDSWVVVRFTLEEAQGERKWIGRVLRINENNTYLVTFVRQRITSLHSGYVYAYPNVPDEETVYKTQILSVIDAPKNFQRKLLFSVHHKELSQ